MAVEDVSVGEELKPERRKATVRRDLNDLVRSPDGKVSEAKGGAVLFKTAMLYIFVQKIDAILADWMILAIFVTTFIAPDLLKKVLSQKVGVVK